MVHVTPCLPPLAWGPRFTFALRPAAGTGGPFPCLQVLQLLGDNLASTPQSLGDAKKESVEELQDRQERVLAASCSALAALLDLAAPPASAAEQAAAPAAAEQELLDGIRAELDLPAFYKTALQSKAAPVRRAAYGLVAAAAERAPARLLAGGAAHTAPAVLGALADKEAGNHEAMWGMLLAYARALPDSWRHISMQARPALLLLVTSTSYRPLLLVCLGQSWLPWTCLCFPPQDDVR